jgi:hypothetical protein
MLLPLAIVAVAAIAALSDSCFALFGASHNAGRIRRKPDHFEPFRRLRA